MEKTCRTARKAVFNVHLRSQHVLYLEYIAEQEGVSVSAAFGILIERHAASASRAYKPPTKAEKRLTIDPRHVEILSRLAARNGVYKADIARRLIDEAQAGDRSLSEV